MSAPSGGCPQSAVTVPDVSASSDRLVVELDALEEGQWSRPSGLPGWTVAHVVAHLALNAEAFCRVASDCRESRLGVMYPGGPDARAADIERLAGSSPAELIDRLTSAVGGFTDAYTPMPAGEFAGAPDAPVADVAEVPLRRLREVEVHGADTGLGELAMATWSDAYVDADLPVQWDTLARRTRQSLRVVDEYGKRWSIGDPVSEIRVDRRPLLAWALDRWPGPAVPDVALPDLVPWGDQSRWLAAPD